jgi:hypothetical protein
MQWAGSGRVPGAVTGGTGTVPAPGPGRDRPIACTKCLPSDGCALGAAQTPQSDRFPTLNKFKVPMPKYSHVWALIGTAPVSG